MSRSKTPKDLPPANPPPLAFRLPTPVVEQMDAVAEQMNERNPHGPRWTRSDVLRECVTIGVERWAQRGIPPWSDEASVKVAS